jgi:hypothetical protein
MVDDRTYVLKFDWMVVVMKVYLKIIWSIAEDTVTHK